jgi:hypothetical protein
MTNLRVKLFSPFFASIFFSCTTDPRPGWPDWAKFRLLGVCLFWAVCLKITKVAQFFLLFNRVKFMCEFWQKRIRLHFGPFSHKDIRSPCPRPMLVRPILNPILAWIYARTYFFQVCTHDQSMQQSQHTIHSKTIYLQPSNDCCYCHTFFPQE